MRTLILSGILQEYDKAQPFTIVRLPTFERDARGLLDDEEQRWLDYTLATDPTVGAVMRGTGGVRKMRLALHGRGKSGGARVIYFFAANTQRIFLLTVYAKNMQDNLSAAERHQMRRLTAVLGSGS